MSSPLKQMTRSEEPVYAQNFHELRKSPAKKERTAYRFPPPFGLLGDSELYKAYISENTNFPPDESELACFQAAVARNVDSPLNENNNTAICKFAAVQEANVIVEKLVARVLEDNFPFAIPTGESRASHADRLLSATKNLCLYLLDSYFYGSLMHYVHGPMVAYAAVASVASMTGLRFRVGDHVQSMLKARQQQLIQQNPQLAKIVCENMFEQSLAHALIAVSTRKSFINLLPPRIVQADKQDADIKNSEEKAAVQLKLADVLEKEQLLTGKRSLIEQIACIEESQAEFASRLARVLSKFLQQPNNLSLKASLAQQRMDSIQAQSQLNSVLLKKFELLRQLDEMISCFTKKFEAEAKEWKIERASCVVMTTFPPDPVRLDALRASFDPDRVEQDLISRWRNVKLNLKSRILSILAEDFVEQKSIISPAFHQRVTRHGSDLADYYLLSHQYYALDVDLVGYSVIVAHLERSPDLNDKSTISLPEHAIKRNKRHTNELYQRDLSLSALKSLDLFTMMKNDAMTYIEKNHQFDVLQGFLEASVFDMVDHMKNKVDHPLISSHRRHILLLIMERLLGHASETVVRCGEFVNAFFGFVDRLADRPRSEDSDRLEIELMTFVNRMNFCAVELLPKLFQLANGIERALDYTNPVYLSEDIRKSIVDALTTDWSLADVNTSERAKLAAKHELDAFDWLNK